MDLPEKNVEQVAQDFASRSDIEDQAIGTMHEVKRDLGRRHINMIAIAGMIVSAYPYSFVSVRAHSSD